MSKKRVLVYPCGTEIGLEVYKGLRYSTHYEIWGGSSSYDHGRFVFENHIDGLPFITDSSPASEIEEFDMQIKDYGFDYIYPAMDGVITVFSKFKDHLTPVVVAPEFETTEITRSKRKTFEVLEGIVPLPKVFSSKEEIMEYPVFKKPEVGQGSVGTVLIRDEAHLTEDIFAPGNLVLEYLPGREFTIDCLTNAEGKLVYARGRGRNRIKNGISVNAVFEDRPEFYELAEKINAAIKQKGAWFFQLREAADGSLKLLEVASRIAGTSAITRATGVDLPLLTLNIFSGVPTNEVIVNDYTIELDRALHNSFKTKIDYDSLYIDYDDTIVVDGKVNTEVMTLVFQCINEGKPVVVVSRHDGDLMEDMKRFRLEGLFDEIHHIEKGADKAPYITGKNPIYVDDSYGERKNIYEKCHIPVFDTHSIECLIK